MTQILHAPANHPLNKLAPELLARVIAAQTDLVDMEFLSAADLCARVLDDLKMKLVLPPTLVEQPVATIADASSKDLTAFFMRLLTENGVPAQAIRLHAANLSHRVQLLRAFRNPDAVISTTCSKVLEIMSRFPATAKDIQCGRNPGDVLDPYILAAAQGLIYAGAWEETVTATITHKILMMIEGLMGHLHEDILGAMRGNVRAPEPRGKDQEKLHAIENPFPGADVLQPPLGARRPLRLHQLKSKTGSAKGGDGGRLGKQLATLRALYGGEVFYDALIGNTLRGHRSMAGVLREAPFVVVLVGESAFRELTGSPVGAQLLLRLYRAAFDVAAQQSGYKIKDVVAGIYATFSERAKAAGEGFLESVLNDAVGGAKEDQDSRYFQGARQRAGKKGLQSKTPDDAL